MPIQRNTNTTKPRRHRPPAPPAGMHWFTAVRGDSVLWLPEVSEDACRQRLQDCGRPVVHLWPGYLSDIEARSRAEKLDLQAMRRRFVP